MDVKYYIENLSYKNGVLSIAGWIFDSQGKNAVEDIQITVKSLGGLERSCNLQLLERRDVADAYGLSNCKAGFRFNGAINKFVSAKVYLVYSLNGSRKKITLSEIEGKEKDILSERLEIEYPEIDGFYNIKNIEKISARNFRPKAAAGKKADVIIPVYNGFEHFDSLFTSLYRTEIQMRVIIVDDCSTDPRVGAYLQKLCGEKPNTEYIRNASNLGFVKSVNKALELARDDVAIINTDVEVPEGWLERLMHPIFTDPSVATSTPYTNCGTICSFPEIGKDNAIFDNRSLMFVDAVFQNMRPNYTEMPTGVGFCMGMSRKAINEVGFLDENEFGKGYGEENDWCQRAIGKGYRNVHAENLFVYHKHGGSFLPDEKNKLLEENARKLISRHPNYMDDAAQYFENDANKAYRKYALSQCLLQAGVLTSIFFNHCLGGGANDYLILKRDELLGKNEKCMEISYNACTGDYRLQINYKDYEARFFGGTMEKLLSMAKLSRIDTIYVNELATYPDLHSALKSILSLKCFCGARLVMLQHDYFSVCPTINLLNSSGEYCGLECGEDCLRKNKYSCDSRCGSIDEWRSGWKTFLAECDSIVVFSEDSKKIMLAAYEGLNSIDVRPHITDRMLEIHKKHKLKDSINIGILGVLNDRKGLKIVKEMLEKIRDEKLPASIAVVGECEEDISGRDCIVTGKYTREQLPRLMYLHDIDIIFISSIWPETFSYTAEEAMKMHMPVAAFNLGAPAERIRRYDKGIIINETDAGSALKKLMEFAGRDRHARAESKKILFINEYESFASRYRVEHLREHLAYEGIASDVLAIDTACRLQGIDGYDAVSVYRCTDAGKVQKISDFARKAGVRLFYDVDDYVFDYDKIGYLDFLKDEEYKDFREYCANIRKCMELCDVLTASTEALADEMKSCFQDKPVLVCRNAASLEMQLLSEIAVDKGSKENQDKVILGYFSGSHTHNRDWALIEDCVIKAMERNDRVELLLAGALKVSPRLSAIGHRVKTVPFTDWRNLPRMIRGIDINLMPLQDGIFQCCKSENKWMEAGLVGIPTIASRNAELEKVMEGGRNAVFCSTVEEWHAGIASLVNDSAFRKKIGDNARKEVYATHLVTSKPNFAELDDALTGQSFRGAC